MQTYMLHVIDRRDYRAPTVVVLFTSLDGDANEGKYREAWQGTVAAISGRKSPLKFYSDDARKTEVKAPTGDAFKLVGCYAMKARKPRAVAQSAIDAITGDAKLSPEQKLAKIMELTQA